MTTLLKSATIIDPSSQFHHQKKDILIHDGKINKIADSIPKKVGYQCIELENLHVSCGWFDSSVSLGEPGFEERETIKNGLLVAAKSGFTAVAVNSNTNPAIDTNSAVEFLINKAAGFATKLYPIASLTRQNKGIEMAELYDMKNSGAIAFGDYQKPIENDNLLKVALLYAQNFDGMIQSFPKNNSVAIDGVAHEGINSTRLGLKGIPALAEHLQIARDLFLLEYTGGKLHIPTISTAKSIDLIKDAKKKGLDVSCSVSVHHLFLNDDDLGDFDGNLKVSPPLRTKTDTKALIKAVKLGVIDMITSDHNPIDIEHKKVAFSEAIDGTIGLETLFGALHALFEMNEFIEEITTKPKTRFGIINHSIKVGETAELSLFDPKPESVFTKKEILSKSNNSAFLGKKLKGKVYGIFANNQLILN
jgi:dihydroorotase